jgi:hypothetical protein
MVTSTSGRAKSSSAPNHTLERILLHIHTSSMVQGSACARLVWIRIRCAAQASVLVVDYQMCSVSLSLVSGLQALIQNQKERDGWTNAEVKSGPATPLCSRLQTCVGRLMSQLPPGLIIIAQEGSRAELQSNPAARILRMRTAPILPVPWQVKGKRHKTEWDPASADNIAIASKGQIRIWD